MKRILSIMAAIVCLWGCGKDSLTDFESEADRYIGTYELADMHWEGSAIDLNNDGRGYWALLQEYIHIIGYYEPNHYATIEMAKTISPEYNVPAIAVNVRLPFPEYVYEDGRYHAEGLQYIPMTIRVENLNDKYDIGRIQINIYDESDVELGDIYELCIEEMTEKGFNVSMRCTLLHEDANEVQTFDTDYLNFTYTRK